MRNLLLSLALCLSASTAFTQIPCRMETHHCRCGGQEDLPRQLLRKPALLRGQRRGRCPRAGRVRATKRLQARPLRGAARRRAFRSGGERTRGEDEHRGQRPRGQAARDREPREHPAPCGPESGGRTARARALQAPDGHRRGQQGNLRRLAHPHGTASPRSST